MTEVLPTECLALSTTTLAKVRGFTIKLLFILEDGARRCCDLAETTGKSTAYVNSYLRRMRTYGLASKDGSLWSLTDSGASFLELLKRTYRYRYRYRQIYNRRRTEEEQKKDIYKPKKLKQVSIQLFQLNSPLQDMEKQVVEALLRHYNNTGSKFIMAKTKYDLAERLKMNPQTLGDALMHLVQDNIIYVYRIKREGITKVGLKKDFLTSLKLKETT